MSGQTKVYYDGACPLCVAEISHYKSKTDAASVGFVDVSKADADLPDGLDAQQAMARFHVQTPDGALRSGAAGFAALWTQVPGWRWLAKLARVPGVTPLMELAYRMFLRLRPLIVRAFVAVQRKRGRAGPS